MRTLGHLLKKEFRQIFRNRSILPLILVMPIIQLLVMPLAADYEIKSIDLSIVDHDRSDYSRHLRDKIIASGYFRLNDFSSSFEASFEQFQQDNSDLVLEIPANFESDLSSGNAAGMLIAVNAINGINATVGSAYLSRILADFNREIIVEVVNPQGMNQNPVIDIQNRNWFNPNLDYPTFMVPGILVILVTMVGAYMCALNIVKEKEIGTIEQINVTPLKKYQFILGKLIPFWVIGMVVFSIGLFGVARLVYGIVPAGSILTLYAFLAIYLVALLGIGLLISTFSATQQQAMSLAFFIMMIFILMSGLFTPLDGMPEWAQWIAEFNPATHFIEVVRQIMLKGSSFHHLKSQFLIIGGMALFFNTWAVLNYRKTS